MSSALLTMLLADGRLPVGGHTQSSGLEPALLAGLAERDIPDFVRCRLATVVTVDAATAVVARSLASDAAALQSVEDAWAARTPGDVARGAARQLGRGQARLLKRLWPDSAATQALARLPHPSRPVAVGAMAAAAGLGAADTARLVTYDDVQTLCAAALKLSPGDPSDATVWLRDAIPAMERVVVSVAQLTHPTQIPAPSAPLMEAWQQAHATRPRRLFSA